MADPGLQTVAQTLGHRIDKKFIYRMLNNRVYIGEAVHKGTSYPGEHAAIIDKETWDQVHAILTESPRKRAARTRADTPALLKGLLFGPDGAAFSPTHTRKGGRLHRYYVSQTVLKHGAGSCPVSRVPAGEIEAVVIDQLRAVLRQPEIVAGTWKAARAHAEDTTEAQARAALQKLDPLWDELFPAEQARIVELLVERVDIGAYACDLADHPDPGQLWPLIETIHIEPGRLRIALNRSEIAHRLGLQIEQLSPALTAFEQPFTQRRRGAETKLISGSTLPRQDPTLQKNIARAHAWAKALRSGQSLAQIAASEGLSDSAIRNRLTLAFLAPQIQRAIITGRLGPQRSTDAILRLNLPADWTLQIKALGL